MFCYIQLIIELKINKDFFMEIHSMWSQFSIKIQDKYGVCYLNFFFIKRHWEASEQTFK